MKKSSLLAIVTAFLLTACGTASQYAGSGGSSRFEDSFYGSAPSFMSRESRDESRKETDALVEKTKASKIYLFGEKKDTVMIPENMSARIQYDKELGSTVVTVGENPYDWHNNINPWAYSYYTPYSIGSSWYWSRHYGPWYWNTWSYTPWIYSGWYDPFYMGGWYDPWYYGYNGWYGGWYGPYYCGWYGGWDPYWDYHYHHYYPPHHHGPSHIDRNQGAGSRREATGTRVHGGTSSRRGTALAGRADRVLNRTSGSVTSSSSSSSRPVRVAASARKSPETSKVSASRPATVRQPSAATVKNYRKPGINSGSSSSVSSGSPAVRQSSSVSRPSGTTYRSESSSGSSEYRSSRSSGSRSSFSSGSSSSSRSSFSSGGSSSRSSGGSRSGGYSGSRR